MNDEPARQIVIVVDAVSYPLVLVDDMTLGEQREFEKIAGEGIDRLADLQERYRTGLVVAWMAVSIKRERPGTRMQEIVDRLDELKPAELAEAWENVRAQSPPSPTPPEPNSDASPKTIELGFDATSANGLAAGLRRATGALSSVPATRSDRVTSTN